MIISKKTLISIFLAFILSNLIVPAKAQETPKKSLTAYRVATPPHIDGLLDDLIYSQAEVADQFIIYNPYNGVKERFSTKVFVAYDNEALYIAAQMYDPSPDSILTEYGMRDEYGLNADYFKVTIDPYNQGQLGFEFKVYANGVEADIKTSLNYEDSDWDAVWKSKTVITDEGWTAEMLIPLAALRFPSEEVQEWGINFWREIRRYRELSSWNYVNDTEDDWLYQSGILKGIKDIQPSLRLSIMPYASLGTEKLPGAENWRATYNAGMDLKYGINESFTLDMTLVPDFSQVESDDEIYNFSPFEIRYDEKRQFFTEGTELFNRCGLFYSRRIGDTPEGYDEVEDKLNPNEIISSNPAQTQLINASKISGRTNSGLGIGFFNAMTANTYATVRDTISGSERQIMTQPFTNYNVSVLDQSLRKNSYISLVNTNVYTPDNSYAANVTGTQSRITFFDNTWAFFGQLNVSQKYQKHKKPDFGFKYFWEIEKIKGNFRMAFGENMESDTYDANDLGFVYNNNEFSHYGAVSYHIFNPRGIILNAHHLLYLDHEALYAPRKFVSTDIGLNSRTTFINHLTTGVDFKVYPIDQNDYFEARTAGQVFIKPPSWEASLFLSPDYRKAFVLDFDIEYMRSDRYNQSVIELQLSPRYRFSDKLTASISAEYNYLKNDIGYVNHWEDEITFGERNITEIENSLRIKFFLSNRAAFNIKLRHYMVQAEYSKFLSLQENGLLKESAYDGNQDFSFNLFNVDLFFTWYFAPGSEMTISWKNAVNDYRDEVVKSYFQNFKNVLDSPAANSLNIKLIYYLDYQGAKHLFSSKKQD